MNDTIENNKTINKVKNFLKIEMPTLTSVNLNDSIKELVVVRLCRVIGLTGKVNFKSEFFDFFSDIVGEAICEILNIKTHIASDCLRFCRFEHMNLIEEVKNYLENESVEESFLDAFELADKFKFLIPKLKKV